MTESSDRGPDRDPASTYFSTNSEPLVRGWALGSALFPGLANPVVFHMLRLPCVTGKMIWLYALYEEQGAEFDSAAQIDPGGNEGRMAEILTLFMLSEECRVAVAKPLAARVAARFGR